MDSFMSKLSEEQKKWLAYAIAGMISADGVVEESELVFLRGIIVFLENKVDINELILMVKNKKKPPLEILRKVDRNSAFQMFMYLGKIAVADDKLSKTEADFLKYAGSRLGFDESFTRALIQLAHNMVTLHKEELKLVKIAENTPPTYKI